ncbi:MAG: aminomethyl-transferring glycine dehydrogenase subunit GcvPA [Bacteroidota bacterium]
MPFFPNTDEDRREMLKEIGVRDFDDLLADLPSSIRLREMLALPKPLSEMEVLSELQGLASQNRGTEEMVSFLGGGAYDHFIPAAVSAILSRPEFYTAYTPYQAEVSQGTLQAIYEYQTMICRLTGMDAANASMYDGGSAVAEAALLAIRHTDRKELVIAGKVHPRYLEVVQTYTQGWEISLRQVPLSEGRTDGKDVKEHVNEKTAAVILQQPNFYGYLEDAEDIGKIAREAGALFIVSVDPISLGLLAPPGSYGADVVVGEGQSLGIPLSFGGPYLGIFALKAFLMRKMPGRLSGITVDSDGERGFTLTLQTREQHIRREKATSNICTNQGLMMLAACVYLSLMGKEGIRDVARLCLHKSHYLAQEITKIPGFKLKWSQPFFKEFVVETPVQPSTILERLSKKGILGGLDLSQYDKGVQGLLVAVTEKRTKEEMDRLLMELRAV